MPIKIRKSNFSELARANTVSNSSVISLNWPGQTQLVISLNVSYQCQIVYKEWEFGIYKKNGNSLFFAHPFHSVYIPQIGQQIEAEYMANSIQQNQNPLDR